jgi:hypothetical protein
MMKPQADTTGGSHGADPAREIEHPTTIVVAFARFHIRAVSRAPKVNADGRLSARSHEASWPEYPNVATGI